MFTKSHDPEGYAPSPMSLNKKICISDKFPECTLGEPLLYRRWPNCNLKGNSKVKKAVGSRRKPIFPL